MSKLKSFGLIILAMIVLLTLLPIVVQSSIEQAGGKSGPDRIVIQLENKSGVNEMPPVGFLHDYHTKAVGDTCTDCHTEEKGATIFKFKRTADTATMDFYHEKCVACHADKKNAGEAFGPLTAECRSCHVEKQPEDTAWKQIVFDRPLHYLHEGSDLIKGAAEADENNCSRCHHQYNEKSKEIFFTKGQEEACIYCHKTEAQDGIRAIRNASHDSCVQCHQSLKAKKISAGPVLCAGCHDESMQAKIEKPEQAPRLKRNQPDLAAITGWKDGGKDSSGFMKAVAFNHKLHEAKTQSCKTCHHQTLKKCSDCHSTDGADVKGGFVSLEKAMHNTDTTQSCAGCHQQNTATKDCAGCHAIMPATSPGSASCETCHSLKKEQLDAMGPENAVKGVLASLDARYTKVAVDKIPEEVTIGMLSDDYKPSSFPHRKVVQAIINKVETNEMAKSFHGDQAGLCMGCHHNSPKTLEPPKCASCHSKNGPDPDGRPGLKGAYHGQCITCHQKMEVETVLATDCVKCHEEKK
jgi:hypothetical protein